MTCSTEEDTEEESTLSNIERGSNANGILEDEAGVIARLYIDQAMVNNRARVATQTFVLKDCYPLH